MDSQHQHAPPLPPPLPVPLLAATAHETTTIRPPLLLDHSGRDRLLAESDTSAVDAAQSAVGVRLTRAEVVTKTSKSTTTQPHLYVFTTETLTVTVTIDDLAPTFTAPDGLVFMIGIAVGYLNGAKPTMRPPAGSASSHVGPTPVAPPSQLPIWAWMVIAVSIALCVGLVAGFLVARRMVGRRHDRRRDGGKYHDLEDDEDDGTGRWRRPGNGRPRSRDDGSSKLEEAEIRKEMKVATTHTTMTPLDRLKSEPSAPPAEKLDVQGDQDASPFLTPTRIPTPAATTSQIRILRSVPQRSQTQRSSGSSASSATLPPYSAAEPSAPPASSSASVNSFSPFDDPPAVPQTQSSAPSLSESDRWTLYATSAWEADGSL